MKELEKSEMKSGVVSIMIPCFNGEFFLEKICTSILQQTYQKLQIVFVNDGSTDKTEEKFLKYVPLFEECGIEVVYLTQKNMGQAAAINTALNYLMGEYCMWLDVDDWMTENHIEEKVSFLEQNPECDVVMCEGEMVEESKTDICVGKLGGQIAVGTLFEDVLLEQRNCTNGLYMVRTKELLEALGGPHIAVSQVGQNLQLLLPILIQNKVGYIKKTLFYYLVRQSSHSHSFYNTQMWFDRIDAVDDLKIDILENMNLDQHYFNFLLQKIKIVNLCKKLNYFETEEIGLFPKCFETLNNEFLKISRVLDFYIDRRIYLWGICKKTEALLELLAYNKLPIGGIIESDKNKCDKECNGIPVIHFSKIEKEQMYIIIPLNVHTTILEKLTKEGFVLEKDYFYPFYQIKQGLGEARNENL